MYLQNSGDFICSDHMKHKGQQFYMPQRTGSIEQIHKFHHMFNKLMQETIQTKSHDGSKNMQDIMAELIWLLTTHI